MKKRYHPLKWVIWTLAVVFYFYEYLIRVFPSVISDELMLAFNVNAVGLGTLSAFYLYAYAPMQIPVGFLMDRFGARKLLTGASIVCGVATLLFSFTENIYLADFYRILMGAGSAFGFIGMVYISSHWFSSKKLAFLVGLGNSIGTLGAVGGLAIEGFIVQYVYWKTTLVVLGALGIVLGFVIYLIIRKEPKTKIEKTNKTTTMRESVKIVLSNPQTWINAFVTFAFYVTVSAFAGLWATPFFSDVYGYTVPQAATAASMIYIGFIVGGPIFGHISDKAESRKKFLLTVPILALFCLLPIIYNTYLPYSVVIVLTFLIGFFTSSHLLNFALAIELNPEKCKGFSLAFANFINFLGAALVQTFVGYLIDFKSVAQNGLTSIVHSPQAYQFALSMLPIIFVIGWFVTLFIKEEKHASHVYYD